MKSAAILINYNDKENTVRFARKLQSYKVFNKILVVDNCSPNQDDLREINEELKEFYVDKNIYLNELRVYKDVQKTAVELIQTDKNGGYNYAINFGAKYLLQETDYDYFMIANTDIEIGKIPIVDCLEELENKSQTAVVAPRMRLLDGTYARRDCWKERTFKLDVIHSTRVLEFFLFSMLRDGEYKQEEYYTAKGSRLPVECISGSLFFIRVDVLKQIGFMDENTFLFYEEDILYKQIKKLNPKLQTICKTNCDFVHYESQSIGKSYKYYNKMKQLYNSKIYYHKTYNNLTQKQETIFKILWICRQIELVFEIPIRLLLKK